MYEKYKNYLNDGKITLKDNATVRDLCNKLNMPMNATRLIFINGRQANINAPLTEGDTIYILPRGIAGG